VPVADAAGQKLDKCAFSAQPCCTSGTNSPVPLFKKLHESVIEEEYTRLEG
jgi:hypothetical protein